MQKFNYIDEKRDSVHSRETILIYTYSYIDTYISLAHQDPRKTLLEKQKEIK